MREKKWLIYTTGRFIALVLGSLLSHSVSAVTQHSACGTTNFSSNYYFDGGSVTQCAGTSPNGVTQLYSSFTRYYDNAQWGYCLSSAYSGSHANNTCRYLTDNCAAGFNGACKDAADGNRYYAACSAGEIRQSDYSCVNSTPQNSCPAGASLDTQSGACVFDNPVNIATDCPESLKDRMRWEPLVSSCVGNDRPTPPTCSGGQINAISATDDFICIAPTACTAPSVLFNNVCKIHTANQGNLNQDGTIAPDPNPAPAAAQTSADAAQSSATQAAQHAANHDTAYQSAQTQASQAQTQAQNTGSVQDQDIAAQLAQIASNLGQKFQNAVGASGLASGSSSKAGTAAGAASDADAYGDIPQSNEYAEAAAYYANLAAQYAQQAQQGASSAGVIPGSGVTSVRPSDTDGDGQQDGIDKNDVDDGSGPDWGNPESLDSSNQRLINAAKSWGPVDQMSQLQTVDLSAPGECPALVLDTGSAWFGELSTSAHCQIVQQYSGIISKFAKVFWVIGGLFLFFMA